ncbi:hypothetical protein FACS1894103_5440 [Campylobacterota bacterium]|nr:hypothetical protein FACS1894103_5440 [Campylobacterota bacterium]
MKRSAFTMIELIFVIVIMGILAAIALPRFASVQDDANIASENAGIASARSGVQAISGKLTLRPGASILITFLNADGVISDLNVTRGGKGTAYSPTAGGTTASNYPSALSVEETASGGVGPSGTQSYQLVATSSGYLANTMGSVLSDGRNAYATGAVSQYLNGVLTTGGTPDETGMTILGPASRSVADANADLNNLGVWIYNGYTGQINWRADRTGYNL